MLNFLNLAKDVYFTILVWLSLEFTMIVWIFVEFELNKKSWFLFLYRMYFMRAADWVPPASRGRWRWGTDLARYKSDFILYFAGDQLSCIIELLGMPPQKLLDQSKRAKNFISSKGKAVLRILNEMTAALPAGYPRYCTATTLPDGTTVLNGGRSRRGKPRGPPGSRELQTALKGCDDPLFLDFIRRCLEWDPAARMTPNAALRHAWLRRRLPRPPQVRSQLQRESVGNILLITGSGRESLGDPADSQLLQLPQLQQDEHHRRVGQSENQCERGRAEHHPQQAQHHQASSDTEHHRLNCPPQSWSSDMTQNEYLLVFLCCEVKQKKIGRKITVEKKGEEECLFLTEFLQ